MNKKLETCCSPAFVLKLRVTNSALYKIKFAVSNFCSTFSNVGGSVAEWLACWTQAQKGPGSDRSRDAVG